MVVVHATDANGKTVPLEKFDVQADLSVVVMDPELPVGEDKIGRWDFTPTQTSTMIRSVPVSGLHIPIRWGEARPDGFGDRGSRPTAKRRRVAQMPGTDPAAKAG